jgi:DNA modification methylase
VNLNTIHQGSTWDLARDLPDDSINCIVTSPPYWGLRDYGMDEQFGLEETPEEYITKLVTLFAELRRALRDDGTLWLNLGDSYAGSNGVGRNDTDPETLARRATQYGSGTGNGSAVGANKSVTFDNTLPPKNLVGIPWRVALALQADGWYLRSDIIWHKPNPMPESVRDRPTKSHEYLFLLTKSARYWYDYEAIKEPATNREPGNDKHRTKAGLVDYARKARDNFRRNNSKRKQAIPGQSVGTHRPDRPDSDYDILMRNKRSVWTIATQPYSGAHFAVFPPNLIEPCILAGCPEFVCSTCGEPHTRILVHDATGTHTVGWQHNCDCHSKTRSGVVLDPFMGAGTTALVAIQHRRQWLGFELNQDYINLTHERLSAVEVQLI